MAPAAGPAERPVGARCPPLPAGARVARRDGSPPAPGDLQPPVPPSAASGLSLQPAIVSDVVFFIGFYLMRGSGLSSQLVLNALAWWK